MSEKTFRFIIIAVVVIWGAFVLIPAVLENVPRVWSAVQYFVPADHPTVTITVKDAQNNTPIADARVQIVLSGASYAASTDKNGMAVFEGVPAGRADLIEAQLLDYDIAQISKPMIPGRQRARFALNMASDYGRRIYVGHEVVSSTISISLIDVASRLTISPPGPSGRWEKLPGVDLQADGRTQRVYTLGEDTVQVLAMSDGTTEQELELQPPGAGIGLSADGSLIFVATGEFSGPGRWLTSLDARTWSSRFQTQIPTYGRRVTVLPSRDGSRVYVAPVGDQIIYVQSARNGQRIATFRVNRPVMDIALSRDGVNLYILTDQDLLTLRSDSTSSSQMVPLLPTGGTELAVGATRLIYTELYASRWLCLLKPARNQVSVLDLATNQVKDVSVGAEPVDVVPSGQNDELYIANHSDNTISVVSLGKAEVIDTIDVRSKPALLAAP